MPVILTAAMEQRTLDLLKQASTATITTQLLARGLRNTFLHGLAPLNAHRMAGPAFTLRYIPAREDIDTLGRLPGLRPSAAQGDRVRAGRPRARDGLPRPGARRRRPAAILATRLLVRGAAGLVTDGTLRDTPEIAQLALPAYAQGPSPLTNLAQHHAVDMQVPIGCAEVPVYPGDVMVGRRRGRGLRAAPPGRRGRRRRPSSRRSSSGSSRRRSLGGARCGGPTRRTRRRGRATSRREGGSRGTPTRIGVQARPRRHPIPGKLCTVLKANLLPSLPRLSRAAVATALSPATAARELGSAAKVAPRAGVDPTGALDF